MVLDTTRLMQCREQRGLSKQETVRRIGVSQPAYLRYESGKRQPSLQVIKEIAKVLHTSVEYLTGQTNTATPSLIEINKEANASLFEIVEQCANMDEDQQQRLLAYIKNLK